MRRSAAPSQLASKRPRFTPPLKTICNVNVGPEANNSFHKQDDNGSKADACTFKDSPVVSTSSTAAKTRTNKDILALIDTTLKTNSSDQNTVSSSSSCSTSLDSRINSNLQDAFVASGSIYDDCSQLNSFGNDRSSFSSSYQLPPVSQHLNQNIVDSSQTLPNIPSPLTVNKSNAFKNVVTVSQPPSSEDLSGIRFYSVVWCKRSTRKHKKWEGDAVLVVKSKSVVLKDMEGKVIGQSSGYKIADLASLEDGNTLPVGGREVEIQGVISAEEYSSGRCFLSCGGGPPSITSPLPVSLPRPKPKPFKLPTRGDGDPAAPSAGGTKAGTGQPLYATDHPHALVFPRPSPQQQFGQGGGVVDVVLDPMLSAKLRPHQREGVLFLYQSVMAASAPGCERGSGCILADEMGLGKTLQCIALVWTLLKQSPWSSVSGGTVKRALVVAPSSLVANWCKEFSKWLGKERLPVYLVDHDHKAESFLRQNVLRVLVISYDMFLRSHEVLSAPSAGFGLVVCDEGHRLKNSSSKTTALLASMPVARRVLLTGTPVQNDLQELFSLSDFVCPGVLGTAAAFRRVYEDPIVAAQQPSASLEERALGASRVAELNRITTKFILRRTQEIINRYLPPKVEHVVFCSPSASQQAVYEAVARLVARTVLGEGGGMDHLAAIMLLRKLCNHPGLLSKGCDASAELTDSHAVQLAAEASCLLEPHLQQENITFQEEDSGKLAVLSCLLWQLAEARGGGHGERVVLVSNFTSTLDMLQQLCGRYGYSFTRLDGSTPQHKRQAIVDKFNSPYSNEFVFLLSSRAGGVGLNLIGASRIVLYDIDWNPATDLQAMARVWRDGQTRTVHIYRLLLCGSVEERMFQRQVQKQGLSGAVVDARQAVSQDAKVSFSLRELKDLFSSDGLGRCLTHEQLQCDCDLRGGVSSALLTQGPTVTDRACQLSVGGKSSASGTRTMDQLYQWQHYGPPHLDTGHLQDPCLEAGADFISLVFKNQSSAGQAAQ